MSSVFKTAAFNFPQQVAQFSHCSRAAGMLKDQVSFSARLGPGVSDDGRAADQRKAGQVIDVIAQIHHPAGIYTSLSQDCS